jgi:hypothetical protein
MVLPPLRLAPVVCAIERVLAFSTPHRTGRVLGRPMLHKGSLGWWHAFAIAMAWCVTSQPTHAQDKPPFHGTIFVSKEILTDKDPTSFLALEDAGKGPRRMFDRRPNAFVESNPWLFRASFDDDLEIEVQANPEFDQDTARREAEFYSKVIGRLPRALRANVKTVWLHPGKELFGGGNQNLLIHTEQGQEYLRDGILEETFCHEAAHTSLDPIHAENERWNEAQALDGGFISKYAKENPLREDVAESYLLCFALRYKRDRLPESLQSTIERVMPNRLKYFDSLDLDMRPVSSPSQQP